MKPTEEQKKLLSLMLGEEDTQGVFVTAGKCVSWCRAAQGDPEQGEGHAEVERDH